MAQQNMAILNPASDTHGVSVYIEGREFVTPVQVPVGAQVSITFKKNGMVGRAKGSSKMEHRVVVSGNMQYQMPQIEWFKLVSFQMVQVKAENGLNVPYRLYINNREVRNGYGVYVAEQALGRVQVRVEGTGYAVYDELVSFAANEIVDIALQKEASDLVVIIDGVDFRSSTGRTIQTISVEGYEFYPQGDKYRLQKKPGFVGLGEGDKPSGNNAGQWLGVIVIALVCTLLGIGLGWLIFHPKETKVITPTSHAVIADTLQEAINDMMVEPTPVKVLPGETVEPDADDKKPEEVSDKDAELKKAQDLVAQLDGTDEKKEEAKPAQPAENKFAVLAAKNAKKQTVLRKADMEKVPELKGLFDALGHYRRSEILSYAAKVNTSDPNMADWAKLVKTVKECPDVQFSDKGYGLSDGEITVASYIDLITKRQAKAAAAKKK